MTIFDLYLLRQTLAPLLLALVVAMLVLLIERMLRLLDLVLGAEGPLKAVFEIMAYLLPHYVALALPISLLIGIMLAVGKLSREGEIDALHGAGVGLFRVSRATFATALVVMLVTAAVLGWAKPYGRYAYQGVVFAVTNAAFNAFLRAGVFVDVGGVTILVRSIDGEGGGFSRVFLFQDDVGESAAITAREGRLVQGGGDGPPVLRLFDGVRLTVRGAPDRAVPELGVLRFAELRTELGDEGARMFRTRGVDERELTFGELWRARDDPPPDVRRSDIVAELHGRIVRVLSVPFLPVLGIPLAIGRRRSDRAWGLVAGILLLVLYNQVLDLGENVVETGAISPLPGLWLPFVVFAGLASWLFWRASERLPGGAGLPLPAFVEPVARRLRSAFARVTRR